MTTTSTRKQRLENFKTHYLLREGAMEDAVNEELSRLDEKDAILLNSLDERTSRLILSVMHNCCEYKAALRLALTLVEKRELPDYGPDLIPHSLKVAQTRHGDLSKHSWGTQRSNMERAKNGADLYRPYLLKAYFSYLQEHSKPPGRSKMEYHTREVMRHEGVPREKWAGLTEYVIKQFLSRAKGNPWYNGKGLLGKFIAQNFS